MNNKKAMIGDEAMYGKILWRILPFILLAYFVCYIDRVNIGFAKLQFLSDLHLNDANYGFATGLFFVTYSLFDIPSNFMLTRIGVRKTMMRIMVIWGLITAAQMLIRTANELYIVRLLFGAAEAGFLPGVMLYLTFWFPDRYRGRIAGLFLMGIPLSGIIGGPLSGMIMQNFNDVGGLRGWQWLFLLEGVPAVLMGIAAFFYLDDSPAAAKWLSPSEKQTLAAALAADRARDGRAAQHGFFECLRDPKVFVMALMNFAVNAAVNAVSFWTPTLLKNVGMVNFGAIGWLTGLVSAVAAVAMVAVARNSDRTMERRWHFAVTGLLFAASFLALPLGADSVPVTMVLLVAAAIGGYCVLTIFWAIPTSYLRGGSAAGGIAAVSMVGAIGSGVSPTIIGWLNVETGSLYAGLAVIAGIMLVGVVLALVCLSPAERAPAAATEIA